MIDIGSVVQDPFGRVGIVCSSEPRPPQAWIEEQVRSDEIRALGDVRWFGVLPFGGGYVLWPEPLLMNIRVASYDDFLAAADSAGPSGREKLVRIFPDFVSRLLEETKRRKM